MDSHEKPSTVSLRIKTSKTDPFKQGVTIFLGATKSTLCPVNALLAYIAIRGQAPGPLLIFSNQQPLTREKLASRLQTTSRAGLDSKLYAGHSFRIGATTAVHLSSVDDSTIMTLGRWKSDFFDIFKFLKNSWQSYPPD